MIQATTSTLMIMLFCGLKFYTIQCDATQADKDSSSNAIAQLTLDMEKCFRSGEENQFFSAFSLSTALAMLYEGAKGNTESQISTALHFNSFSVKDVYKFYAEIYRGQSSNYTLDLANRLFAQDGFSILPTYLSVLNDYFLAPLQLVDYKNQPVEAAKTINNFVNNATEGLIPNMLPENAFVNNDRPTVLAIVNAIYFRGFWVYKFNSSVTESEEFTTSNGQKVSAQIMMQFANFSYAENDALDCKILQLEYLGGDTSMTIILPNKYDGIVNLLSTITADDFVNFTKKSSFMETEVEVKLPKFKFEKTYDEILVDCLKGFGITDVFEEDKSDLTGIATTDPRLMVGKVIQKAVIEVDEEGSKAAAATVIRVCRSCTAIIQPKTFYATQPFLFLISDSRTDVILFFGVYMKPV